MMVKLTDAVLARVAKDGRKQALHTHAQNVSGYAQIFGNKCGIGEIMHIAGCLHDMGKASPEWQEYLKRNNPNEKMPHSIYGAKHAYDETVAFRYAAELIANIIAAHHGELYDSISPDGTTPLIDKLASTTDFPSYDHELNIDINILKEEFMSAIVSVEKSDQAFGLSMLTKFAFSCLVDADRLDAYLMESQEVYKAPTMPDWGGLILALEHSLHARSKQKPTSKMAEQMAELRQKVSEDCQAAGLRDIGIYKLEVPTGGGKTLSSLRFALEHAKKHKLDRIIYVIPYLSILSQTADEIRTALGLDEWMLLEHHSNFLSDPNDEKNYKLHTDRWDAPIILTTQVQFLESIFSARGSDLRKLHHMAQSVMIFDEAQSMPIKCIHLFNSAMNFLNRVCKSTILLCTATQPPFGAVLKKICFSPNPSLTPFIKPPQRYHLDNKLTTLGYTFPELAAFVQEKHQISTLVIVNTKAAAKELYKELKVLGLPALHLSTGMCSAHRDAVIAELRRRISPEVGEPVICVSTQLIEAGVDISLDCVIRDLAGLDSIYQAAGRCNRHGDDNDVKNVYVVNIKGENLNRLPDIKIGAEITQRLTNDNNGDLHSIDISEYYRLYFDERCSLMDYDTQDKSGTVYDLLSENRKGSNAYRKKVQAPALRQAIHSAADEFFVIDKGRTDIIVPYGASVKLLNDFMQLQEPQDIKKKHQLLKE
ncbi:MAG: CRISPR-associated helicase Cas3', partial [Deferribacteraceae bacterium]|nr:CRISPR-associated helicase Cas3' [Deferribacteraceae bacterium]